MTFEPAVLGITSPGLDLLRDLVHERTGLFYGPDQLVTLADRLAPLVVERGFSSFLEFYYRLKYDADAAVEWQRVVAALAVPETYFWREVEQIQAMACHVVPELAAEHPGRPVRICSIPCATGEEPLTIALVLDQMGAFGRWPIEIHAGDGSPAAIAGAEAARYRERAFRSLPPALRDRYFERDGDRYVPQRLLRSRVTSWRVVNLMSVDDMSALVSGAPIVFCRNLFIYFSPESVGRAVSMFSELMAHPAYLCLGAAESLMRVPSPFALERIGDAFVYVRR